MANRKIYAFKGILNFFQNETLVQGWNGRVFWDALQYIKSLDHSRLLERTAEWFLCLDQIGLRGENNDIAFARLKSARLGTRIPLIKPTLEERENPKDFNEGERIVNHVVIRLSDGLVLVDRASTGPVTASRVSSYIETKGRDYFHGHDVRNVIFEPLLDRRFLDELDKFERIDLATVRVLVEDTRFGQNDATRFLQKTTLPTRGKEVTLSVKASRAWRRDPGLSVVGLVQWFEGFFADQSFILSASIHGTKRDGSKREVRLKGIEEKTTVQVEVDQNGDVLPDSVLSHMIRIGETRERIR